MRPLALRHLALASVAALALVACGKSSGGGVDARGNLGDGCAHYEGRVCPSEPLMARCGYAGYGTKCSVDCSFPRSCSFSILVGWGKNYCCSGNGMEMFSECECNCGTAICRWYKGAPPETPTTYCEFCGVDPGSRDAGTVDLNADGPDAPAKETTADVGGGSADVPSEDVAPGG